MRTKQLTPSDLQINKAKREILCVASTDDPDRDAEVVLPSGLRTSGINYAGRPVLWAHDKTLPAIGSILWLKVEANRILAKYRITDKTEFANDIFNLLQDDCLKDHSIGFEVFGERPVSPLDVQERPDWQNARNVITDFEVLELSICNVPCNPNAAIVAKGYGQETRRILGDKWEAVDCWQYAAPPVVKAEPLPIPKYARKVDLGRVIKEVIRRHDAASIIAKIKGLA